LLLLDNVKGAAVAGADAGGAAGAILHQTAFILRDHRSEGKVAT